MDLHRLRYFMAVADELHFTRAARRLHVAQPALSAQIRRLEAEVGAQLFERTTRSVSLTQAGHELAVHARRLMNAHDAALAATRGAAEDGSEPAPHPETLVVGITEGGIGELTIPALERFRAARPDVTVRTRPLLQVEQHVALRHKHVDALLTTSMPKLDELEVHDLVVQPAILAVAPSHRLVPAGEAHIDELLDEVIQPSDPRDGVSEGIFTFAHARNGELPRRAQGPASGDVPELLAGVRDGRWAAFGWRSAMEVWSPAFYGYATILVTGAESPYRLSVVARRDAAPVVREFVAATQATATTLVGLVPGGVLAVTIPAAG